MRWLRSLWLRLPGLLRDQNTESRFNDELEGHILLHADDNLRAGMSPEEARRQALIKLGGMAQTKEMWRDRRRLPLLETLLQDLRYGLRMLRKNPGFSTVAIVTLGLGIGANTAIFSIVNGVILEPLPYRDPGKLFAVYSSAVARVGESGDMWSSPPDFRRLRQQNHTLSSLSDMFSAYFNLTGTGDPEQVLATLVSHEYFATLGVTPSLGREFLPAEEQWGSHRVVILSHDFWKSHFNSDRNITGRTLKLDGETYAVVGVMPETFFTQRMPQIWVPMAFKPGDNLDSHSNYFTYMVGRLKPGVTPEQADSDLNSIMLQIAAQFPENKGIGAALRPLRDDWVGKVRPALLVLLAAVGLVLLIACGNLASLMLARARVRRQEIAIRCALGASRIRLLRQLLTESVLLSLLGGAFGFLLGYLSLNLLPLAKNLLPRLNQVHLNGAVLFFTLGLSVLTGVFFGLLPAIQNSGNLALIDALKEGGRTDSAAARSGFRPGVIATEVALATVLLIGSGLAIKSFQRLLHVDAGFDATHVLTFEVNMPPGYDPDSDATRIGPSPRVAAFFQNFIENIERLPGVKAAGATSTLPLQGETWGKFFVPLDRPLPDSTDKVSMVQYRPVAGDYFTSLDIRLMRGRFVDSRDRANSPLVVVVNDALARKFWPGQNPIGKTVLLDTPDNLTPPDLAKQGYHPQKLTVVGLVGDAHYSSLAEDAVPVVYASVFQQDYASNPTFTVRTGGDPESLIPAIRAQLAEIDKELPIARVATMDQIMTNSVAQSRLQAVLLGAFGGLALLLAAVGIYGVMAYSVSRRVSEIGIRMALGANRWDVLSMICKQGLLLTTVGLAAGLVLALALTRLISKVLFGVSPTDPATFAMVTLVLAAVALLACYFPARRATRVDPMIALRHE